MGINSESEISADLQIGPTDRGMVRLYLAGNAVDLPLDFDPEQPEHIADELRAAAGLPRQMAQKRQRAPGVSS